MNVLVTGGAGYIGGAVSRRLRSAGHSVILVDDLSTGHRDTAAGFDLLEGDFADAALVGPALRRHGVGAIVHMAAHCLVGESMQRPAHYYENNVTRSLRLLDLAIGAGVTRFVFSSSAAVYGEPERTPIDEDHPTRPTNPYGETKLAFERALAWHAGAHPLATVSLRYFNAAGATADGAHGERHDPESHLVPNVLAAAAGGQPVEIFGSDYPTPDGTAVRDYVHIEDLAEAHRLALDAATMPGRAFAFNLGNGDGFSVLEVIEAARRVTGRPIESRAVPRRPGDPARLVASSERARRTLGWTPRHPDLDGILHSAWTHLRKRPR
jgi:UDP-glucose-4-epimerase GalE